MSLIYMIANSRSTANMAPNGALIGKAQWLVTQEREEERRRTSNNIGDD